MKDLPSFIPVFGSQSLLLAYEASTATVTVTVTLLVGVRILRY